MHQAIKRAAQISRGLAGLAGKKLKAGIAELAREGVITKQEGQKVISQISKAKKMMETSVVNPLKKLVTKSALSKARGKKKR